MRSKKQLEADAEKNHRAHQAAEAAALALLLTARSRVDKCDASFPDIATSIARTTRNGIVLARQNSRSIGVARFEAEAASAGVTIRARALLNADDFERDWRRGARLGKSYADRWLDKAVQLEDAAAASEATVGSLERIAVSESSEAFSSARSWAAAESSTVTELLKAWDAMMDACPLCWDEDGTIVGVAESFPNGEPGSLHPRCLCSWSLLTMSEASRTKIIKIAGDLSL